MKLNRNQTLNSLVSQPGQILKIILFHGQDAGLARDLLHQLLQSLSVSLSDPFRVSRLLGSQIRQDPSIFGTEMASQCLIGGRRVVIIDDIKDSNGGDTIVKYLSNPIGEALAIIFADDLPSKSSLRQMIQNSKIAVAVPCYSDSSTDIRKLAEESFKQSNVSISKEALTALVQNIGNDRMVSRNEIDKLSIYAGNGGKLSLEDINLLLSDSASITIAEVIAAASSGNGGLVNIAIKRAIAEGANSIQMIGAAIRYFQKIEFLNQKIKTGVTAHSAVTQLQPPVFWKDQDLLIENCQFWHEKLIARVLNLLSQAELLCKTTSMPDESIAYQTMVQIAILGKRKRR